MYSIKAKKYREENKEKLSKQRKEHYYKTRDKQLLRRKDWYEENKENISRQFKKEKAALTGAYIKRLLSKHSEFNFIDIPQDMIDFKRDQVILARKIKAQT